MITALTIISNGRISFDALLSSANRGKEKSPSELLAIMVIHNVNKIINKESINTTKNVFINFISNKLKMCQPTSS